MRVTTLVNHAPHARIISLLVIAIILLAMTCAALPVGATTIWFTERVSVADTEDEANGASDTPALSENGRFVVFNSQASNLVTGDTNGRLDTFVRDTVDGTTERVSVSSAGVQGDNGSVSLGEVDITPDGRYVVFASSATTLVTPDSNGGGADIFLRDRTAGVTERISVSSAGVQANGSSYTPSISDDGRYVAFQSTASNLHSDDASADQDIYVRDRQTGATHLVSRNSAGVKGNGPSWEAKISGDGAYVIVESEATNLVDGDNNARYDLFRCDWQAGTTERVSLDDAGAEESSNAYLCGVSFDGRYVAFESDAPFVASDTNGGRDIFVRDMAGGTLVRASVADNGAQSNNGSYMAAISADGMRVVFRSDASNLVTGDVNAKPDIFVRDMLAGTTTLASVSSSGVQSDAASDTRYPAISPNGRYVAYQSPATTLVAADNNATTDVFRSGPMPNRPPAAHDDAYEARAGHPLVVSAPGVLENDTDVDADDLLSVKLTDPAHGTLDLSAAGGFTYTPDTGFIGTDTFQYRAEEGFGGVSDPVTVSITVAWPELAIGSERLSGEDRYQTAIAASKAGFESAETVVIATGANWPDALGGSALAGAVGGPLLLTRQQELPSEVAAEVVRLGAKEAYILGGTAAVGAQVEEALAEVLGDGDVTRLDGVDRYATAARIADETIAVLGDRYTGDALVATGGNFPDATGASPLAAALGRPILLANPVTGALYVPDECERVIILGGVGAVSADVESALETLLGNDDVDRNGGANRYETASMVAQAGVDAGMRWDGVGLATGENFPDALAGGAVLGAKGSVMLLTTPTALRAEAHEKLSANAASIGTLYVIGGPNAVSEQTKAAAEAAAGL